MMEWLHTGLSLTGLLQDVRYGLRQLRKSPGFTTAAVVTLALGIGATTAIFSLVDGLMLKPLSFPNADRLARIESVLVSTGDGGVASYPDFVDWRAENHSFEGMGVFETKDFTLAGRRESLHLQGAVVSAQLFSLLGVTPAFGRTFLSEEDSPVATNGTDSVILSYGLWQREFGSDASILGRAIRLDGQPFTVVGVMRPSFQFPVRAESVELWTTIAIDAHGGVNATTANRGAHYLDVIGLLKQGVSLRQAQTEMVTVASGLNHQHPEVKPRTVRILPETQALIGPLRAPLSVLLGAVLCVLLLVCANLANLQLARATSRQKEMAVRAALGASRRRVVCQLITESVTLGLMGGSLGLGLALQSVQILVRLLPVEVPRLNAIGLDARLLGFTFLISVLAGVLFGIAPALRVSKIGLTESLMERGQGSGSDAKRYGGLRNVLVVSEVALAAVLLPGAALLIQSFLHLTQVDPGFDPHHVLAFQLDSSPTFLHDVVTQMSAQPGVSSASAVASLPLTGDNIRCSIEIEGQPTPIGSRPSSDFNAIEPNYLRTLGIALVAGRDFTERDDLNSTPVAIINRTLARRFFPNQDPIGKHIRPGIGAGGNAGETANARNRGRGRRCEARLTRRGTCSRGVYTL